MVGVRADAQGEQSSRRSTQTATQLLEQLLAVQATGGRHAIAHVHDSRLRLAVHALERATEATASSRNGRLRKTAAAA